jgi:hypothetical protein
MGIHRVRDVATPNPGVPACAPRRCRYLLVRRRSHTQEILAVGMDRDLRYFEEHAKDDPEFMLLLVAKVRVNGISEEESIKLKKKLIREAWRPGFYKSE